MTTVRTLLVCSLFLAVPSAGAAQQPGSEAPVSAKDVQVGESRLGFYGYLRTDVIYDDSRPDAFQTPLYILPESEDAEDRGNFTMHPRLSRLGMNFTGPAIGALGDAKIAGRLELDFQNGGRESRAIPRFRHAFFTLNWKSTSLLFGQSWDIISPLFPAVNADTLMWAAGNLGDRRPQIRFTVQPPGDRLRWSLVGGIGLTGAVDAQDLDGDGVRDGEAAETPDLQVRFGLSAPMAGRRAGFGAWARVARHRLSVPLAGQTAFGSHAVGADYEVPLGRRAIVRGEVWTGRNLSDVRGGIAQSINRETGEEIASTGAWTEVGFDLTTSYTLFAGYTVDAPDRDDLPASGRTRNDAWFLVNRFAFRPFTFGVDYLHWTTQYLERPDGADNRVNAYFIYSF